MEFGGAGRLSAGGCQVRLSEGAYHEVDSSETAFKIACSHGVQGGRPEGQPRPRWSR